MTPNASCKPPNIASCLLIPSSHPAMGRSSVCLRRAITQSVITYWQLQGRLPPARTRIKSRTNHCYEYRGTLKAATSKLCAGYEKGRLHMKPRSRCPPEIPSPSARSVALGESALHIVLPTLFYPFTYSPVVRRTGGGTHGWAVKAASAASYHNVDRA